MFQQLLVVSEAISRRHAFSSSAHENLLSIEEEGMGADTRDKVMLEQATERAMLCESSEILLVLQSEVIVKIGSLMIALEAVGGYHSPTDEHTGGGGESSSSSIGSSPSATFPSALLCAIHRTTLIRSVCTFVSLSQASLELTAILDW